jgi:hypothetical protein
MPPPESASIGSSVRNASNAFTRSDTPLQGEVFRADCNRVVILHGRMTTACVWLVLAFGAQALRPNAYRGRCDGDHTVGQNSSFPPISAKHWAAVRQAQWSFEAPIR